MSSNKLSLKRETWGRCVQDSVQLLLVRSRAEQGISICHSPQALVFVVSFNIVCQIDGHAHTLVPHTYSTYTTRVRGEGGKEKNPEKERERRREGSTGCAMTRYQSLSLVCLAYLKSLYAKK